MTIKGSIQTFSFLDSKNIKAKISVIINSDAARDERSDISIEEKLLLFLK